MNELYISAPYFTDQEAARIRSALVDHEIKPEVTDIVEEDNPDTSVGSDSTNSSPSVQEAIQTQLSTFFDKRRASGDARPCGPHDMVPIYGGVFGMKKEELRDEKFLARLRRSGLGDFLKREADEYGKDGSKGLKNDKRKKGEVG